MANIFEDFQADRTILVEVTGYDVVGATETTFYLASKPYITEPTDTPANTLYQPVIDTSQAFSVNKSMFTGNKIGGGVFPQFGGFSILNTREPNRSTGRFDDWVDSDVYTFDGRSVVVYVIETGTAFSTKQILFTGIISNVSYGLERINIGFQDNSFLFNDEIQSNKFTGAGGANGVAELKDRPIPLAYGQVFNYKPPYVDTISTKLRYQLHNGAIQSVDEVRDNGVPLTLTTDYTVDLANGYIELIAAPAGDVTVDFKGSTLGGAYSAKVGDIVDYIVGTGVGVTVDASTITTLNAEVDGEVGFVIDAETIVKDVLDVLANTANAYYTTARNGDFQIYRIADLDAAPSIDIETKELFNLTSVPLARIVDEVTASYRPNLNQQSSDSLGAALTEQEKQSFVLPYKSITKDDSSVATKHASAASYNIDTLFYNETDADEAAEWFLDFFKARKFTVSMTTSLKPLQIDINDSVRITAPFVGYDNGQIHQVISMVEDYIQETVTLGLIGGKFNRISANVSLLGAGVPLTGGDTNDGQGIGVLTGYDIALAAGTVGQTNGNTGSSTGTGIALAAGNVSTAQGGTGVTIGSDISIASGVVTNIAPTVGLSTGSGAILAGGTAGQTNGNTGSSLGSGISIAGGSVDGDVVLPVSYINSVQRGSISLSGVSTATDTITSVDTSKSIVLLKGFDHTGTGGSGSNVNCYVELTNATTVTVTRDGTSSSDYSEVYYEVVEFTSDMVDTIQTGLKTFDPSTDGTSVTSTITSVDTSRSCVYYQGYSSSVSALNSRYDPMVNLASATTVGFAVDSSASQAQTCKIPFTVIEFSSDVIESIQHVDIPSTTTTATAIDTTITSVDLDNSIVMFGGVHTNSAATTYRYDKDFSMALTSTTNLRTLRQNTLSRTVEGKAVVVEFAAGVLNSNVQRGDISIPGTSATATITSVNTAKSITTYAGQRFSSSSSQTSGGKSYVELTNATTVTAGRASGTATGYAPYEVVEFN